MRLSYIAAAAALLAAGSALAYQAPADLSKDEFAAIADEGAALAAFKYDDKAMKAEPAFAADAKPLVVPAAAVTWEKAEPASAGDPDLDLAETSIDESVPPEPVIADPMDTQPAVGGPFEEVAAADLAPRPASQNYPPCRPGPGDDNCIQLYEPGVRTALASWTAPTGGLSDGTQVAMGGPEEPVGDEAAETESLAMNGDGVIDEALGESQDVEEV